MLPYLTSADPTSHTILGTERSPAAISNFDLAILKNGILSQLWLYSVTRLDFMDQFLTLTALAPVLGDFG
jgi:hypothetical protein